MESNVTVPRYRFHGDFHGDWHEDWQGFWHEDCNSKGYATMMARGLQLQRTCQGNGLCWTCKGYATSVVWGLQYARFVPSSVGSPGIVGRDCVGTK